MNLSKYFGPSTLVAAAFIGPGTLTTCTLAGVESGYTMLWAMLFSIFATLTLQEMSARIGWKTQTGLGEVIHSFFQNRLLKSILVTLVVCAIIVGNAAYEAGNISGAVLGLELFNFHSDMSPLLIGVPCAFLLWKGNYKLIEYLLIILVLLMCIAFLCTAFLVRPNLNEILHGFIPAIGTLDPLLLLALIGTTVVPYNLFLHASLISKKHDERSSLKAIRIENAVSILLGGMISMLIIITAAATRSDSFSITNAQDLALQLTPVFGDKASWVLGVGLLAAGFSSALTAPLAASYAFKGIFNTTEKKSALYYHLTWIIILLIGVTVAILGSSLISVIKFAQVANAIILPILGLILCYLCNQTAIVGKLTNTTFQNLKAYIVIFIVMALAGRTLYLVF